MGTLIRGLLALALAALVAACGEATTTRGVDHPPAAAKPFRVEDGEVQVSCGGDLPGWSPSAMAGAERPDDADAVTDALEALLVEAPMDAPLPLHDGVDDEDWFVLTETDDTRLLAVGDWAVEGGPQDGAMYLGLDRTEDGWDVGGWGDCQLRPVLTEGADWVELALDGRPGPGSTSLALSVNELACTGGRDPAAYLHEPFVEESDDRVVVFWTTTPPEGANDCVGNPAVPRTLELDEPLGDRTLYDGSTWPPQPLR